MPIGQYIISRNDAGFTHADAVALATAHGGSLAAVTSATENTLILGFLAQDDQLWTGEPHDNARSGPWIGLTQPPGSTEPAGGWTWDTGEIYDFTAWHSGQPDNYLGDSYGIYWDYQGTIGWGDHFNDPVAGGYGPVISAAIEVVAGVKALVGTAGHDLVWGGAVGNRISGLGGDDSLSGNGGRDAIIAGTGRDTMLGGAGNDRLIGGAGGDSLTGGAGADHFIYLKAAESHGGAATRDVIGDFSTTDGDTINLTALDAIPGGGHDPLVFRGELGFTGTGQVRVHVVGGDTYVDVNLSGGVAPEMRIVLTGVLALDIGSFDL